MEAEPLADDGLIVSECPIIVPDYYALHVCNALPRRPLSINWIGDRPLCVFQDRYDLCQPKSTEVIS